MSEKERIEMTADGQVKSADDLMAEFDRESNTRRFTGVFAVIMSVLFLGLAAFCFGTRFITLPEQVRMSGFLGVVMFLGFLIYPPYKNAQKFC